VTRSDSAPHGATEGRHVGWRRWRRAFAAVLLVVIVCGLVTARLLVWPAQGMPTRVSAIAMLAGPGDRLPVALTLAREHRVPVLVISRGYNGYGGPCPAQTPGAKLICFDPVPPTASGWLCRRSTRPGRRLPLLSPSPDALSPEHANTI
jgi:hypothetical protein